MHVCVYETHQKKKHPYTSGREREREAGAGVNFGREVCVCTYVVGCICCEYSMVPH
jgi:hypothetical protein